MTPRGLRDLIEVVRHQLLEGPWILAGLGFESVQRVGGALEAGAEPTLGFGHFLLEDGFDGVEVLGGLLAGPAFGKALGQPLQQRPGLQVLVLPAQLGGLIVELFRQAGVFRAATRQGQTQKQNGASTDHGRTLAPFGVVLKQPWPR